MGPGKKLDEFVARHVLEWRSEEGRWIDPETDEEVALKPFSNDVAAAWEIVDRICDKGFRLQLNGSRIWQARFYKSVSHTLETHAVMATAPNPAAAICLAALSVKGIDLPKG